MSQFKGRCVSLVKIFLSRPSSLSRQGVGVDIGVDVERLLGQQARTIPYRAQVT